VTFFNLGHLHVDIPSTLLYIYMSHLASLLERYANHLAVLLTATAIGIAGSIIMPLFRKSLDVRGKVRCIFPLVQKGGKGG
jgi:hypothetical protein